MGEHHDQPLGDSDTVLIDDGAGKLIPAILTARLRVSRELFYGQYPIRKMSGFKDELSGQVITNAFEVGLLDPDQVESDWLRIGSEADAPITPVIVLQVWFYGPNQPLPRTLSEASSASGSVLAPGGPARLHTISLPGVLCVGNREAQALGRSRL